MNAQTPTARPRKQYRLLGPDRKPYRSRTPGRYGGYRPSRLYGRLDCPSALRAIARGGYVQHRVFFPDQATAVAAGYRPCAVCLPDQYTAWKARAAKQSGARPSSTRRSTAQASRPQTDHRPATKDKEPA